MTVEHKVPFARAYWIVPGKLMGGCYPGDRSPAEAEAKLRGLLSCGVSHIVNLMEENEVDHDGLRFVPYQENFQRFASESGVQTSCVRYPIRDMSVTTREHMRVILDDIDAAIAAGQTVYLHCWGGVGRTGTVAACYLARHALTGGRDVLTYLAELRRQVYPYRPAPESEDQRAMARSWKKGE